MLPDPGDQTILYIDHLELQTVVPDHVEGWDVAPGKIAFSHTGYTSGSTKTAIASGLNAPEFSLIEQGSGKVVSPKPVEAKDRLRWASIRSSTFRRLQKPGNYLASRRCHDDPALFASATMHGATAFGRPSISCTANAAEP